MGALRDGTFPFQDADGFFSFFDAMFSDFPGASFGPTPRGRRGADQLIGVGIILKEAVFDTQGTVSFTIYIECEACHGPIHAKGIQLVTCSSCGGPGMVMRISNTMFDQVQSRVTYGVYGSYGTIISSPYQECAGQGRIRSRRNYLVDIPAGVTEGTRIRVPNKAEADPGGGPQRDLYLEIHGLTDEAFVHHEDNLHVQTTISMTTTALGTDFMLSTFDGECTMAIPTGTQPGEEVIFREPNAERFQRPGRDNLHTHIRVEIPKKLDARSCELLEELVTLHKEERVEPQRCDHPMFGKLREEFIGQ